MKRRIDNKYIRKIYEPQSENNDQSSNNDDENNNR